MWCGTLEHVHSATATTQPHEQPYFATDKSLEHYQPHLRAPPSPPQPPSIPGLTTSARYSHSSDLQSRVHHNNSHNEEPESRRPRVEIKSQIAVGIVDAVFGRHRISQIEEFSGGTTIRETICTI
jgi:hypothetical protein